MPSVEGTARFFLDKGGDGKDLPLATACHVVIPHSENKLYECRSESQPRHEVLVLSKASFQQHLTSINDQIEVQATTSIFGALSQMTRCANQPCMTRLATTASWSSSVAGLLASLWGVLS